MDKRSVSLEVDGLELIGEVYIPKRLGKESFPALCLCHGIPAQPSDPTDRGYPLLAEMFCAPGFVVMIFNFRGTGGSGGDFDIMGWTRDLEAAIDHLYSYPEVDKTRLSLMGFSGGAAVSVYTASKDSRVTSLVACACPSEFGFLVDAESAQSLLAHCRSVGIIRSEDFPPSFDNWIDGFKLISPIHWIDRVAPRPLLIIHGDQDEMVKVSHAWSLYEKAGEPKEIAIIEGGEHGLRHDKRAIDTALEWLKIRAGLETSGTA